MQNVHAVIGNHKEMMGDYTVRGEKLWMRHGGQETLKNFELFLQMRRSAESIWNGHTPVERIYYDGVRMNCDLGSNTYSVICERALGIVNLTEMTYLVYKQAGKTLEKRRSGRY